MNTILVAILLWLSATFQLIDTAIKSIQPQQEVQATMNDSLIDAANVARASAGCKNNLVPNDQLMKAAQERAEYVANDHWTHDGNWETIVKYYKYRMVGENLAKHFNDDQGIINGWLNSKTHKEVLLNCKYKEAGVGRKDAVVVQLFGTR